ncbi:MAG: hypothetical protein WAM60_11120, partial [Candidatus Promineifilaceae bacterium]
MKIRLSLTLLVLILFLAACAGASEEVESTRVVELSPTVPTEASPEEEVAPTEEPMEEPTEEPGPTTTPAAPPTAITTPTPIIEERVAEVEWPPRMRLGNSDTVRLAVVPNEEGLTITTEFPEHEIVTQTVTLEQPAGYDLALGAQLDGIGFSLSPEGDQVQDWQVDEPMVWHWTISPERSGQHRLTLTLTLHRVPQ